MPVTREDMRTVERVASRFVHLVQSSERSDAVSDGMLVLEQAVTDWESDRQLRQKCRDNRSGFISRRAKRGMIDGLRQRNGRAKSGYGKQRFRESLLSLDKPVAQTGSGAHRKTIPLIELIGEPDADLERVGESEYVTQMLARLPAREREVVERHVLGGETEASIGKDLGVSESRISQICATALSRIRDEPAPTPREQAPPPRPTHLSEREMAVLQEVANDKTNKEIARALLIGEETVKSHLRHIHAKLGVSHRAGAVARGFRLRVLR